MQKPESPHKGVFNLRTAEGGIVGIVEENSEFFESLSRDEREKTIAYLKAISATPNWFNLYQEALQNPNDSDVQSQFTNLVVQGYKGYFASESGQQFFQASQYPLSGIHLQNIERVLEQVSPFMLSHGWKVLDLGSGAGGHLRHLAENCAEKIEMAAGLDNNRYALEKAKEHERIGTLPVGTFVKGEVTSIPFENETFNLIYSRGVMSCLPMWGIGQMLREAHRVMESGGIFYGNTRAGNGHEAFPFQQLLSEDDLRKLAQRTGWEVLAIATPDTLKTGDRATDRYRERIDFVFRKLQDVEQGL